MLPPALLVLAAVFLLPSCASSTGSVEPALCFESQEKARSVGQQIFDNGFTRRVNYWLTGDASNGLSGLGLLWGGISPEKYCAKGQFPIVITYKPTTTQFEEKSVLEWSNLVLRQMLRELETE